MSDYRDDRDYLLYDIDRDSPWYFDETRFGKYFTKQEGLFRLFRCFSEGHNGDRGPQRRQRAVEGTKVRRGDRGP
jgi:hypothetical protein